MRLQGTVASAMGPAELYDRLSDPRLLEDHVPAVEAVDVEAEDRFNLLLAPETGLGRTPLRVAVEVADRRPGEHVRLRCSCRGPEYAASVVLDLDFSARDGGSEVAWTAESHFAGVISSLGQRILPAVLAEQVERIVQGAGAAVAGSAEQ